MGILEGKGSLSPDEFLAVSILGREAGKRRDEVQPGKAKPIDILLRVQGTINVGVDGTSQRGAKPSPEKLLGFVLSRLDGSDRAAVQGILQGLPEREPLPDFEEGYLALAKQIIKRITPITVMPRKGQTSGTFRIGLVNQESLAQSVHAAVQESTRIVTFEEDVETIG